MEHIDWIVSFVIFVFVILAIITAIPRFLPGITNQEDIYTSKMIYSSLIDNIESYNFHVDSNKENIFYHTITTEKGRANTSYLISNNLAYGVLNKEATFYYFDSNQYVSFTKIFSEKLLGDNLNYFLLNQGNLTSFKGEGYLIDNSEIESIKNYSNFYSEFILEPKDVNIYFNYVSENQYSLCALTNNDLRLYDKNLSGEFLIQNSDFNFDDKYWINLEIKSDYKGNVICNIEDETVENNSQTSIEPGKIIIKNQEEMFVSDFILYNLNNLIKNGNLIETYNFDINLNNNVAEINVFENRESLGKIKIEFSNTLNNDSITNNQPGVVKNNISEDKIILFPNIKETIIINDQETLNFTLEDLKINYYDYEIEEDTDFYIWIKTDVPENDIKTIYLKKVAGYTPETSFTKSYDSLTHPTVTVTDLGNGFFEIEINNLGESALNNYEIRLTNEVINVSSISESLFIGDIMYSQEEGIVLVDKEDNKYILLDFFDINNSKAECDLAIISNGFSTDCSQKTFIKLRITDNISEYPKIKYLKNKKEILTYEVIEPLIVENTYDAYINIYNNKQNIEIGNFGFLGDFKIFERFTKYLNEKGQEEIVKVLIKPN